jgi:hypothetical protein
MALKDHTCEMCSGAFTSVMNHAKYCSRECKNKRALQWTGRYVYGGASIPTGTVGAISELAVAADLMRKGYAVFRALSPSCWCDLIAHKDGVMFKVEVRTAYKYINPKGEPRVQYPRGLNGSGVDWYGLYERNSGEVFYRDTKTHADIKV